MPSLASILRSWFVSDVPRAPARPTAGELLHRRIEREPAFELGRYAVIGGYRTHDDGTKRPELLIEMLADMRHAAASYDGNPYLHPVTVSMAAIDWLEMCYESPKFGRIQVGMPAVLDGRWIADDIVAMIDVAATAAVDAITPRSEETLRPVIERLAKLARFGRALMHAMKDETGAHVTLHSPFGPADVRQHADTGAAPYAIYRLPNTKDFDDIPEGYEFEAWDGGMSIKRCRSMGYEEHQSHEPEDVWERRRFIERGLVYFDPTPLPDPDPMPELHRVALAAIDGRRVLTVRWPGQHTFSLPDADRRWMSTEQANEAFGAILNTKVEDADWMASGKVLSGSKDTPDAIVGIYHARLAGDPSPPDGICDMHWLDIDAPDRPVDDSMRHSLLPAIRQRLAKKP